MPARTTELSSQNDCRITAEAVVVAARADGRVDLEFGPGRQCAGCAGTCLWKRLQKARLDGLEARAFLAPGTEVTVALPSYRLLVASLLLYGSPLAAILAGAAAGSIVAGSDAGTLIGALAALAVVFAGFGIIRGRLERATLAGLTITARQ